MAKVTLKKKIDAPSHALDEVKTYARKIWLAGLGAYAKVGSEGGEYFKELVKGRVEVQLDKVEKAFDSRVASALNRIGIASKHDVETLSAKLEELTALLERVARKH